jgi:hypothetical protein
MIHDQKIRGRDHLEDFIVNNSVILKSVFKKLDMKVWTWRWTFIFRKSRKYFDKLIKYQNIKKSPWTSLILLRDLNEEKFMWRNMLQAHPLNYIYKHKIMLNLSPIAARG